MQNSKSQSIWSSCSFRKNSVILILMPAMVILKKHVMTLTYQKRGYGAKKYQLTSTIDGWFWGNILFGGFVGFLIVDPLTGAMYKLPESVNASWMIIGVLIVAG